MFCQIVEASRLHDIGEQGKNVSNVIDELLHQFELIVKPQALEVCTQRIRTQNCNLELSHAHIHDEESCDSPSGQFSAGLETDGLPFRNRRTCESIPPLIAGGGECCAPKISIEGVRPVPFLQLLHSMLLVVEHRRCKRQGTMRSHMGQRDNKCIVALLGHNMAEDAAFVARI